MKIKKNNLEIEIEVEKCRLLKKTFGLMFSRRNKAKNLLFEFSKPVSFDLTSLFVFFPFVCIWLNDKNEIINSKIIKPFQIRIPCNKKYSKFVEIPIISKNKKIISLLVGKKDLKRIISLM
jgi:uncharacterized membrane protein (UPF0127 family)